MKDYCLVEAFLIKNEREEEQYHYILFKKISDTTHIPILGIGYDNVVEIMPKNPSWELTIENITKSSFYLSHRYVTREEIMVEHPEWFLT